MHIDFAQFRYQYQRYKDEIDKSMHAVLDKSNYIMGEEVHQLEEALCNFTDAKEAITCAGGTEALLLAMMALDIRLGDKFMSLLMNPYLTDEEIAYIAKKVIECSD